MEVAISKVYKKLATVRRMAHLNERGRYQLCNNLVVRQCLYGSHCYYFRLTKKRQESLRVALNQVSRHVQGHLSPTKLELVHLASRIPAAEDLARKLYCSFRERT